MTLSFLKRLKPKNKFVFQEEESSINVVLKTSSCVCCKKEKPTAFFKYFNGTIYSTCNKCLTQIK